MSLALQIQALREQGCSVEEISEGLGIARETVEYELLRQGQLDENDIPEEDFGIIRQRLISIAKECEDDNLAAKVGMFLWAQKRGMPRAKNQIPALNIGVVNALILQAHERIRQELSGGNDGENKLGGIQGNSEPAQKNNKDGRKEAEESRNITTDSSGTDSSGTDSSESNGSEPDSQNPTLSEQK